MSEQNPRILNIKVMLKTGVNGNGIKDIELTSSSGLVDTYTITLDDDSKYDFDVTNGSSIQSIAKTSTSGLIDTYTITLDNGQTSTFTVTNGSNGSNANLADISPSSTATKNYDAGDHLILDDKYYIVTQPITSGATIEEGVNVEQTTVGAELKTKVSDNPIFTEASTRENIVSGETFATILGKIKKWFTDIPNMFVSKSGDTMSGTLQLGNSSARGELRIMGNDKNHYGSFYNSSADALTDNRRYNLPNKEGTIALKNDFASGIATCNYSSIYYCIGSVTVPSTTCAVVANVKSSTDIRIDALHTRVQQLSSTTWQIIVAGVEFAQGASCDVAWIAL